MVGWLARLALAGAAMFLVACQATARVGVSMTSGGSGAVTVAVVLDRQAAARVGDVRAALRVADLERAGWIVDPVVTAPTGDVTASIHRSFRDPAEANALLRQLGPIQLTMHRHHGLISSSARVQGAVDLRNGVDAFADPALSRALGTGTLAAAVAQLRATGGDVPDLHTDLVVRLPGHAGHVASGGSASGGTVTWSVPLGQQAAIGASSRSTDLLAVLWFALALAALAALAVLVLLRPGPRSPTRAATGGHDRWSPTR